MEDVIDGFGTRCSCRVELVDDEENSPEVVEALNNDFPVSPTAASEFESAPVVDLEALLIGNDELLLLPLLPLPLLLSFAFLFAFVFFDNAEKASSSSSEDESSS